MKYLKTAKNLILLNCITSLIGFTFSVVINLLSYYNYFHLPNILMILNNTGLIICVFLLLPIYLISEKIEKKGISFIKVSRSIEIKKPIWKWILLYLLSTIFVFNAKNDYLVISAAWLLFYSICLQASFHFKKVFDIFNNKLDINRLMPFKEKKYFTKKGAIIKLKEQEIIDFGSVFIFFILFRCLFSGRYFLYSTANKMYYINIIFFLLLVLYIISKFKNNIKIDVEKGMLILRKQEISFSQINNVKIQIIEDNDLGLNDYIVSIIKNNYFIITVRIFSNFSLANKFALFLSQLLNTTVVICPDSKDVKKWI